MGSTRGDLCKLWARKARGGLTTLFYPAPGSRVVEQLIGDVPAGAISHQSFRLVATRTTNSVLHFTVKLTYGTAASSATFENNGTVDIIVSGSAVGINISGPPNIESGQN